MISIFERLRPFLRYQLFQFMKGHIMDIQARSLQHLSFHSSSGVIYPGKTILFKDTTAYTWSVSSIACNHLFSLGIKLVYLFLRSGTDIQLNFLCGKSNTPEGPSITSGFSLIVHTWSSEIEIWGTRAVLVLWLSRQTSFPSNIIKLHLYVARQQIP